MLLWRFYLWTLQRLQGKTSTAALGVCILATKIGIALPADPEVHAFFPDTNSWVRLTTEDLPERLADCTAVHLSYNTTMVISGGDNNANIPRLFSRRLSQFTTELVSPLCSCFCMLFQVWGNIMWRLPFSNVLYILLYHIRMIRRRGYYFISSRNFVWLLFESGY